MVIPNNFLFILKKYFKFILLFEEDKSSAAEQLFSNKITNGNISISQAAYAACVFLAIATKIFSVYAALFNASYSSKFINFSPLCTTEKTLLNSLFFTMFITQFSLLPFANLRS
jgi:hypothetical protein